MKLTEKQNLLLRWVILIHENQERKYTNIPYWTHCLVVAERASEYGVKLGFEIGLCHDLIEDTSCTLPDLLMFLMLHGYDNKEALFITSCVNDLTDKYTKTQYPKLNRKARKELEAERLGTSHPCAQSVKYCDLMDNIVSICEHDPEFAKIYLKEKQMILSRMRDGDSKIREDCQRQLEDCQKQLEETNKALHIGGVSEV